MPSGLAVAPFSALLCSLPTRRPAFFHRPKQGGKFSRQRGVANLSTTAMKKGGENPSSSSLADKTSKTSFPLNFVLSFGGGGDVALSLSLSLSFFVVPLSFPLTLQVCIHTARRAQTHSHTCASSLTVTKSLSPPRASRLVFLLCSCCDFGARTCLSVELRRGAPSGAAFISRGHLRRPTEVDGGAS